jgi:hypothetical protein
VADEPRWEPDTDSHGHSILGPSGPDRTGYADLDRARLRWRWAMLGCWVAGLFTATALAALLGSWPLIVVGLAVVLLGTFVCAFGTGMTTERARIRREDERRAP